MTTPDGPDPDRSSGTEDPSFSAGSAGRQSAGRKIIIGYCEPWTLRAGEDINLMASSHEPGPAEVSVVRLHCGDQTSSGPGFSEAQTPVVVDGTMVGLTNQPLRPGSYATVDLDGLSVASKVAMSFSLMATRPSEPQTVATIIGDSLILQVVIVDGVLRARASVADLAVRPRPLANRRWYDVTISVDIERGTMAAAVTTSPSTSPASDLMEPDIEPVGSRASLGPSKLGKLVLGGDHDGAGFDGRIAAPSLTVDDVTMSWDLSQDMDGPTMVDSSGNHRHGVFHQLPARAVTGPTWNGTQHRWTDDPGQWNAVHFHKDDLYDAGWTPTTTATLPADLPSGIYAFRVRSTGRGNSDEDRVPFFVRPADGAPTADVALLMSSATYLAYANHRMLFEGADFIANRSKLRPEHDYVRLHPELGRSMYEKHPDGSGVMFSSRRRPVLNLRPGADRWNFTPDTDINAFLHHLDVGHDIVTDEDLHAEGFAAIEPYRVLVTCTHPEYWSTAMLDGLERWQRNGGRLLYLGGNGFYWRVAFSDKWPGAMELRRAEDGVRNWETETGESYHAFGGEYGGMWRRNGRPPNQLVGIGFAAQGFEKASYYMVNPGSLRGRAAWIWEGVEIEHGRIGTSGLGGGAAGQELDRYDTRLGSPDHAVILASATDFGPDMLRTKEEFEGSVAFTRPDPYVRSDIVFFETPNGGAVFSVGSISWFGALARNGYDNDVATMTANVVRRFLDPAPFERPA